MKVLTALVKPITFILCSLPLAGLVFAAFKNDLGSNPVEHITHDTGVWAFRLLFITLCATPLRDMTKWAWPLRIRRMLGLFAFFYASLHLLIYLWLDQAFTLTDILIDIGKRPYITVGFLAFLLLVPLAVTSNKYMVRKLKQHWKPLHMMIYPITVLAVLHYVWLVKADLLNPAIYLVLLILLLTYRAAHLLKR